MNILIIFIGILLTIWMIAICWAIHPFLGCLALASSLGFFR